MFIGFVTTLRPFHPLEKGWPAEAGTTYAEHSGSKLWLQERLQALTGIAADGDAGSVFQDCDAVAFEKDLELFYLDNWSDRMEA